LTKVNENPRGEDQVIRVAPIDFDLRRELPRYVSNLSKEKRKDC
jgi:hypothetical protein